MPILSLQQAQLELQVDKAVARAADDHLNLAQLKAQTREATPDVLDDAEAKANRLRFLDETLPNPELAGLALERIIAGNELQPVNYLELGALAARSVCRVDVLDGTGRRLLLGTGFLIAPGVLLTNNHVLAAPDLARASVAEFNFELDALGDPKTPVRFALAPDKLFYTHPTLDFSVVAVAEAAAGGGAVSDFGFLPLIGALGKVLEGEWLTVIQHPAGNPKQVCVRENKLMKRTDDVLWYSTDTLGGSSGAPVFNNAWQVVALHHSGVPQIRNGRWQTIDGRDYDPAVDREDSIKWVANEGIRISRIVDTLRAALPSHRLLADVFEMTPALARKATETQLGRHPPPIAPPPPILPPSPLGSAPDMTRSVTVTLDIAQDGRVTVRDSALGGVVESLERHPARGAGPARAASQIDVPFDTNYANRQGYDGTFLGHGFVVHEPDLGLGVLDLAAPLLGTPADSQDPADYTLKYVNLSVMMDRERRMALWTAANVDGSHRHALGRPRDNWRRDPRISRDHQLDEFYFADNKFDRGHLTRREDMEFGPGPVEALKSAADTFHFPNCSPQHSKFNQIGNPWQDLEVHVLEESIKSGEFKAMVFTGPILAGDDPVWDRYPDIQYPLRFWKVAVALTSGGRLFATAFLLDQSAIIDQFGIEAAGEIPFGAFRNYQTPVAEIERLTGLSFRFTAPDPNGVPAVDANGDPVLTALSEVDPLAGGAGRRRASRRSRTRPQEGFAAESETPDGYVLLEDGASIIFS